MKFRKTISPNYGESLSFNLGENGADILGKTKKEKEKYFKTINPTYELMSILLPLLGFLFVLQLLPVIG